MFAQLLAGFPFDDVAFALSQISAQEGIIIRVAQKAYSLTVAAVSGSQSIFFCNGAHFTFHHAAHRESQLAELRRRYLAEKIRLVFHGVFRRGQNFVPSIWSVVA